MAEPGSQIRYLDEASDELEAAAVWYEVRREGLGLRFYQAVDEVERIIVELPESGSVVDVRGVPIGVRRHLVAGFPYEVVYISDPELVIVAVAHSRRRPGYWRRRV